jgi:hypothetical protein
MEVGSVNVAEVILCDVYGMAQQSYSLPIAPVARAPAEGCAKETPMLDKPEINARVYCHVEGSAPFEVASKPKLVADLARQQKPVIANCSRCEGLDQTGRRRRALRAAS